MSTADTGKKKKRPAKKIFLRIFLTVFVFLLMFVAFAGIMGSLNMPRSTRLSLFFNNDGSLMLTWNRVPSAGGYHVRLQKDTSQDLPSPDAVLFEADVREPVVLLPPEILDAGIVRLRINTYRDIDLFGLSLHRTGSYPLNVTFEAKEPAVSDIEPRFDDREKTMRVTFDAPETDGCSIYLMREDGNNLLVKEIVPGENREDTITFGESGDLPLPDAATPYTFTFRATRTVDRILTLYGKSTHTLTVTSDDLKSRVLALSAEQTATNRYTLSWEEAAGEGVELRLITGPDTYETLGTFDMPGKMFCDTGILPAGRTLTFELVSVGGTPIPGRDYAAEPARIDLTTEISVIGATVWPAKDLPLYTRLTGTQTRGTVAQLTPLCVLEEEDGYFKVRTEEGNGYIDASSCLINLPDMLGDHCEYDITSSYCCICRIQGYAIPGLTGEVVEGYENVMLADGTFLVPYLYPLVDNFLGAVEAAAKAGYRIKFYDSFRPLKGQMHMYNTTRSILDLEIPEATYERLTPAQFLAEGPKLPAEEELPPRTEGEDEETPYTTYHQKITEGGWHIGWFLANGANQHNYGSAMDITLVGIESGEEALMQSPVHELSVLAVLNNNTEAADLMQQIMKDIGYSNLRSEWWHFQDDNAHVRYGIPAIVEGVSIEGFKYNGLGWRYRTADGTYLKDTTVTIGGNAYTFDKEGYTDF